MAHGMLLSTGDSFEFIKNTFVNGEVIQNQGLGTVIDFTVDFSDTEHFCQITWQDSKHIEHVAWFGRGEASACGEYKLIGEVE